MKPLIVRIDEIMEGLKQVDPIQVIEEGFIAYSDGKVNVPDPGELLFEDPPGQTHIKYGAIKGDDYYVVKIASGFPGNTALGLSRIQGLMLLYNQKTGEPEAFLLDNGYLTTIRTAAAGAVCAKYLAPKNVSRIGVFGVGIQGQIQTKFLADVVDCRDLIVWNREEDPLEEYQEVAEAAGFNVTSTYDPGEVADSCNLIVTCTPSHKPLLQADQIRPGTHITALGSDTPEKIELDPQILANADVVVADSLLQSRTRGEISQATRAGKITEDKVVELGNVIAGKSPGRTSDDQLSVSDLTGVAVQDIQITKAVFLALQQGRRGA
jgi:ornithine cyclodeaminase